MQRKKRKTRFYITGAALLLLLYILNDIWMVTSVKNTVRTLYLHPDQDQVMIDEGYVTDTALRKFFRREIYPLSKDDDTVRFNLSKGRGLHYILGGTVWVDYTFIGGIDPDTGISRYGSSDVPIRLKVKLDHGHWKITDKYEEP